MYKLLEGRYRPLYLEGKPKLIWTESLGKATDSYCQGQRIVMESRSNSRQRPVIDLSFVYLLQGSGLQLCCFLETPGKLKMHVSSPRNSDVIGLGYPLDIRVCSCLLGNSNMQPGLRATEPTEVKFARPIIGFIVVLQLSVLTVGH